MQPQVSPFTDDPTAVLGRRTLAFVIDALLGTAVVFIIVAATFTTTEFGSTRAAGEACEAIEFFSNDTCVQSGSTAWVGESGDVVVLILVWGAFLLLNTLLIPGMTGWSVGKLIMGLRVVKQDTFELAGMGPNIGRGLLWVVDAFPWFLPLAGFVLGLATPGHRRMGDMAAKTFVVDKSMVGVPTPVRGVGPAQPTASPVISGYTPPPGMPVTPPPPGATPPPPVAAPPPPAAASPPPPTMSQSPVSSPPPTMTQPQVSSPPPTMTQPQVSSPPPPSFPAPSGPPVVASPTPSPPAAEPPAFPPVPDQTEVVDAVPEPPQPEPDPAPAPDPAHPGIEAPQWDEARNTYIQWDPELNEWMEWNEPSGRWIPISR